MQFQGVKSLSTQSVDNLLITVLMNPKSNTLTNDFPSMPIFWAQYLILKIRQLHRAHLISVTLATNKVSRKINYF